MKIYLFKNEDEMANRSAKLFYEEYLKNSNSFKVMLSGGSTPINMYKIIISEYKDKINWENVLIFFGDERFISENSSNNNYKNTYENFLKHIPIPKSNIFKIRTDIPIEKSIIDYENKIITKTKNYKFNLIYLGIGNDGHTASLFPDELKKKGFIIYTEKEHGNPPLKRISVNFDLIEKADKIIFMSNYKKKEKVLNQIIENFETVKNKYPTTSLKNQNIYYLIAKDGY
ncbi:6-phosphogluconolactonase [Oceanotoga teriensis]|uniref:6-phosphogluconolactonase n=1 Tax=Oceanotoga teriensis TaxID=515440 RepID=A0AA45HJ42_9BACT|nr:6-phosphogluconolactonase [Oceanotoga teriensis]PWJ95429.1 6-phosphogluconolactonase [Oceanotoga teriensis]